MIAVSRYAGRGISFNSTTMKSYWGVGVVVGVNVGVKVGVKVGVAVFAGFGVALGTTAGAELGALGELGEVDELAEPDGWRSCVTGVGLTGVGVKTGGKVMRGIGVAVSGIEV